MQRDVVRMACDELEVQMAQQRRVTGRRALVIAAGPVDEACTAEESGERKACAVEVRSTHKSVGVASQLRPPLRTSRGQTSTRK